MMVREQRVYQEQQEHNGQMVIGKDKVEDKKRKEKDEMSKAHVPKRLESYIVYAGSGQVFS